MAPAKFFVHRHIRPQYACCRCETISAARDNLILSRSALAEWVGRVGVARQPLADRLIWHLLQGNTLHADESVPRRRTGGGTPLQV